MKRLPLRIVVALFTFAAGIYASAVWVSGRGQVAQVAPPPVPALVAAPPANGPVLEMVFVIDTTGSMGGLIDGAKQRVWGIINEAMQSPSKPSVRVGLVAYRDRGDEYVTQVLPLTDDLDKVYSTLMDYSAGGGGDTPENVRRALADGVHRAGWTRPAPGGPNVAQILFLVGDAPPHDDYRDEPDTLKTTAEAVLKGMTVNAIQCGDLHGTREIWQAIAQRGEGRYFAIAQDGGVRTLDSPYDTRLAELGNRLGGTYTAYGGGAGAEGESYRAEARARQMSTETKIAAAAPVAAQADRAVNKMLNTLAYAGDLLQSIENGSVKLEAVKDEDLPEDLRKLSPADRQKEVDRRLAERRKLREEITTLSRQRDEFISAEKKKRNGGRQDGFDAAVSAALKEQMARRGIE